MTNCLAKSGTLAYIASVDVLTIDQRRGAKTAPDASVPDAPWCARVRRGSAGASLSGGVRVNTCLHLNHGLAKSGASNGVGVWCRDCEQWVTKEMGRHSSWALPKHHPLLEGINRDTLPRVHAVVVECEICQLETKTPELHHWCPKALYATDPPPNEGPQAYLCPPCHKTWHAVVTPGLLPHNALELVRALYRRLKDRPGAWDDFVRVVTDADAKVQRRIPRHAA